MNNIHVIVIICHRMTEALKHSINEVESSSTSKAIVHVDKKTDIKPFLFIKELKNVELINDRVSVHWGDVSQIKCMLNCLMYARGKHKFKYVSLISGDDVFYRGLDCFNEFLKVGGSIEYIGVTSFSGVNKHEENRYLYRYPSFFYIRNPSVLTRIKKSLVRNLFKLGFFKNKSKCPFEVMYKGSNWFTMSYSCLEYVLSYLEINPSYISYFDNSYCCDEIFFQSIVYNSSYREMTLSVINNSIDDNLMSLRQIDWVSGPDFPKVYSRKDLAKLPVTNTFVIRKISEDIVFKELQTFFWDKNVRKKDKSCH